MNGLRRSVARTGQGHDHVVAARGNARAAQGEAVGHVTQLDVDRAVVAVLAHGADGDQGRAARTAR